MIDGPVIVAALMALVSLMFFMERAWSRVKDGKRRARALIKKRGEQVQRIKKLAAATMVGKRDLRRLTGEYEDLRQDCADLEGRIQTVSRADNRLFVLEERRVPADNSWVVLVTAQQAAETPRSVRGWSSRKFLVWAPDAEAARVKAERRYPPANGFGIGEITAWVKPKPKMRAG
jgi:hypothetical protein